MALRYAMETDRIASRGDLKNIPSFGQKMLLKKRIRGRRHQSQHLRRLDTSHLAWNATDIVCSEGMDPGESLRTSSGTWRSMSFCPLVTEPKVWRIIATEDGLADEDRGLMLVYVDEEWELGTREWLNAQRAVRFLGKGIMKVPPTIFLDQEDYIRDLLQKNGTDNSYGSGVPIAYNQVSRLQEENGEKDAESIRQAQKATGELMWVGTRTRPDLMYSLSYTSRYTLKSPTVIEVGAQTRRYLRNEGGEAC